MQTARRILALCESDTLLGDAVTALLLAGGIVIITILLFLFA